MDGAPDAAAKVRAGFTPDRDYRYIEINRGLRALYPGVVSDVIASISQAGGEIAQNAATDILAINENSRYPW